MSFTSRRAALAHGSGRHGCGIDPLVFEHVRRKGVFSVLSLSYVPVPGSAEKFYRDLGFKPTGQVEDGDVELELSPNQPEV